MKLKVNPTRQELLKIKKRVKTARSGHKLLKEKLDGLMQEFLANIKDLKKARAELELRMTPAVTDFFKASNRVGGERISTLVHHIPDAQVDLSFYSVMGVKIRKVGIKNKEQIFLTEVSRVSSDDDFYAAKKGVEQISENIISYANLIIKIRLLAEEIEKTRRRVNSLEHIYIPEMERVMKYIAQKLEERERFDRTVILKLKEMIN